MYRQKFLDSKTKLAIDSLKTDSKTAIQKTSEETGDLVGNKIAEKSNKAAAKNPRRSKTTQIDETSVVTKEIPKERYIRPKKQQKIIDELRLLSL